VALTLKMSLRSAIQEAMRMSVSTSIPEICPLTTSLVEKEGAGEEGLGADWRLEERTWHSTRGRRAQLIGGWFSAWKCRGMEGSKESVNLR